MKDKQPPLFDPSDFPPACAKTGGHMIKPLPYPLWTKHKATLIARYLYYFVLITKHGTYIDGLSGPQNNNHPEMWAAQLVIGKRVAARHSLAVFGEPYEDALLVMLTMQI